MRRKSPELAASGGGGFIHRDAEPVPVHRRGLVIVDRLTARWGTELYPWGKQVWGELWVEGR